MLPRRLPSESQLSRGRAGHRTLVISLVTVQRSPMVAVNTMGMQEQFHKRNSLGHDIQTLPEFGSWRLPVLI